MNHDAHHGFLRPSRVITREGCFRYGRLQFADVGGNSGDTLAVPVEAQYWDEQRFVTNTANSGPHLRAPMRRTQRYAVSRFGLTPVVPFHLMSVLQSPSRRRWWRRRGA
ncbi:DUF6701 domain-containing protein [Vibrio zhugei]|uniref:DUF6701 domain-containing protein n=1 Tax=Vibrio zhugei TaxID=2479546 RepID=A0ABV7C7Y7_9VIBR